jgi:hypothetical protein
MRLHRAHHHHVLVRLLICEGIVECLVMGVDSRLIRHLHEATLIIYEAHVVLKIWVHVPEKRVLIGRGVEHIDVVVKVEGRLALAAEVVEVSDKGRVQPEVFLIV